MTRYFRLFSQFTIILARMPAMTEQLNHARRPCPALRASYSRLCCNDNVSRLFLNGLDAGLAPVMLSGAIPATCRGFSLSSNQCHQGLSPRNIAPHRNPSGLSLILRLFFCSGISHVFFTLCCAFRRILSACNRCIFLFKKAAEFPPAAWSGRKLPLRQPDARMTRYFRLFSQFTIILARIPAMTGAARPLRRPCPVLRASYSRLSCNDNVSRLFLYCLDARMAPVVLSGAYLQPRSPPATNATRD